MIRFTKDTFSNSPVDVTVETMPLYGIEKAAGLDDSLPTDHPLVPFRVYDDDGELMGEGELHDDPECENQTAALRWAETNWGCTKIEVRRVVGNGTTHAWIQDLG